MGFLRSAGFDQRNSRQTAARMPQRICFPGIIYCPRNRRRTKMTIAVRNYLPAFGVVALLLLVAPSSSLAQRQVEARSGNEHLSQYCVPHDDEDPDAQRIYC